MNHTQQNHLKYETKTERYQQDEEEVELDERIESLAITEYLRLYKKYGTEHKEWFKNESLPWLEKVIEEHPSLINLVGPNVILYNKRVTIPPCHLFIENNIIKTHCISLAHNKIRIFPIEFTLIANLTILDLSHNEISHIPKEICRLDDLEKLILFDNNISVVPDELYKMKCLQVLDLRFNLISYYI